MDLLNLSAIEQNVLIGSILGDGEITKLYHGSRRKNNSYREHFSPHQLDYRIWKLKQLPLNFYFNQSKTYLLSSSLPLLTQLFPYFYNADGNKIISFEMLQLCNLPQFLATLYLDDGSLSISIQKNDLKKIIYLTPHIFLYLQCFSFEDLVKLQNHIYLTFSIEMNISKRPDGFGYILKTTKVSETMKFLSVVFGASSDCPSMFYKTNWEMRFAHEIARYQESSPNYKVIASTSDRSRNYTQEECNLLRQMKNEGAKDKDIALKLNRTYWSIVYKWRELKNL